MAWIGTETGAGIRIRVATWLGGPCIVACGPSADELKVVTQRELLVLQEATDDDYHDPMSPAFDLFLVRPDRTRQQVPVSTAPSAASA